jgi:hypothetical protein
VGAPLLVGETVLMRRPTDWVDLKVEVRAVDKDLALVRIIDHLERVPLVWLFRAETLRYINETEDQRPRDLYRFMSINSKRFIILSKVGAYVSHSSLVVLAIVATTISMSLAQNREYKR